MKRAVLTGMIVALVAMIGVTAWRLWPEQRTYYSDADTIREPAERSTPRDILWQPPARLAELINTTGQDYEPRLSWDGLTLYFVRGKAGGNADIHVSRRTPAGWTEPEALGAVNSEYDDLGPEPSADGDALYFYSDRPGGTGGYDLWVARRGDDGWLPPTNLGPQVNSEFNDYGPALAPDGVTLYYASNRPRPTDDEQPDPHAWVATVREDRFSRTYDLYTSRLTERGFTPAEPLDALNTPYDDGAPCVSPVGDFLYFTSNRPGGEGGFDLFRSRLVRGSIEPPTNLGESVNTSANELDPGLGQLGFALFFSSDRERQTPAAVSAQVEPERPPDYDLYYTSSREVFSESETIQPTIHWAGLWSDIWPWLLLALLALALLLLLRALMGGIRDKRLSLLMRCLLASLMAHLLLLLLMSFWEVSASISDALNRRGEIRVALASAANDNAFATQLLGELTQVDAPQPQQTASERREVRVEPVALDAQTALEVEQLAQLPAEQPAVEVDVSDAPTRPTDSVEIAEADVAEELPFATELDVPLESDVVASAEPEPPVLQPSSRARLNERARVAVPTTQPVARSVELDVNAEAGGARDARPVQLAAAPAAEDARPRSSEGPAPPVELAAFEPSRLIEATLPAETTPADQAVVEVRRTPQAAPAVSQRAQIDARLVSAKPAGAMAEMLPEAVHPPVAAKPLADDRLQARDAAAQPLSLEGPRNGHVDPALPPMPDLALSLPTDAAPREDAEAASPALVVADAPMHARAELPADAAKDAPDAAPLVAIAPPRRASRDRAPRILVGAASPQTDAAASPARPTLPHPDLPPIASGATPFGLRLPTETEPPLPEPDELATRRDAQFASDESPRRPSSGEAPTARQTQPPRNTIGMVGGLVSDATTGLPLVGVRVRLDLPDQAPVEVVTDQAGYYVMFVPRVPDHFVVSASRAGYVPASVDIEAARLEVGIVRQDLNLRPEHPDVIALEPEPEVHHLGNDRFEGRINSQFQRTAQGRRYTAEFELTDEQLAGCDAWIELSLLAKGVQCPHRIYINGKLLSQRLDESPRDGSFGRFRVRFQADLLGLDNTLEIRAVSCSGDLDDFEFVNIQVDLTP